jgi:hypothetical protein
MRRANLHGALLLAAFCLTAGLAQAAQYSCEGVPHGVGVSPDGAVFVESWAGFSWVTLCNLTTLPTT